MTEAQANQDKNKSLKDDLDKNGNWFKCPRGIPYHDLSKSELVLLLKTIETNQLSKVQPSQSQLAEELKTDRFEVSKTFKKLRNRGFIHKIKSRINQVLSREHWKLSTGNVVSQHNKCCVPAQQMLCPSTTTIEESRTVPDFSDTPPPTDTLDQFKKEVEESEIKNGQVSQGNTCDTSYDKYNNEYGKIVANHVHKGYLEDDLPYIRSFIRNVHGLKPFTKAEETAFLTYKDWASDDNNGAYVADRMEYYTRAVEKGLELPVSLSRNGRYIKFNKSFREDFWKE